jgi:hypothetical protein
MALADLYGSGSFNGLTVLVPGHPNRYLDLLQDVGVQRWALRYLEDEGEEHPYEPDELVPWAHDESGNTVWWHVTDPGSPASWPVVANEARGPEWQVIAGGAVAAVTGLVAGRVASVFMVVEWVSGPVFVRHPHEPAREP